MLNYSDFTRQLEERLAETLGEGFEVHRHSVIYNNTQESEGLVVRRKGETAAPVFALKDLYRELLCGKTLDDICRRVTEECALDPSAEAKAGQMISCFARIRDRIVRRLVNTARNRQTLEDVPHRPFLNLSIVYYCLLDGDEQIQRSVMISNQVMEMWRLTENDLYILSEKNLKCLLPWEFVSMRRVLGHILHMPVEEEASLPLFVLSNEKRMYGSVWMTDREVLSFVAETLGGDYYILPSSIHECLILPVSEDLDPQYLLGMVTEINRTEVEPRDVLADAVYFYDVSQQRLSVACEKEYAD